MMVDIPKQLQQQKKRKRETEHNRKDTPSKQKKQRHSRGGEKKKRGDGAEEALVQRITALSGMLDLSRPRNFGVPELKRWLRTLGKLVPSELPTKKLDLLKRIVDVLEQKKYEFPVKKKK